MTPFLTRRLRALPLALVLAGVLSGCAAVDAVSTFTGRDPILPGERQALIPNQDPGVQDAIGGVSVGGATANASWPQPGGNAANAFGHVAYSGGGWRTTVPSSGRRKSLRAFAAPVVDQGLVYVYGNDGTVSAQSLASGGRAWVTPLAPEGERGAPGGGIAASGGRLYVATGYGTLHALDGATGGVAWTREFETPFRSAPTVAGGRLYVADANNVIYAFGTGDGEELWQFGAIPEQDGVLASASPAVSGSTVVVPSVSGQVIALNTANGEPRWADNLVRGGRNTAGSAIADVAARPVIVDGVVYAIGTGERMIATRLSSGERVWQQPIAGKHMPIVSGNTVFVVDALDRAMALDRSTGNARWVVQLPSDREAWAGPLLAGNRLWVASSKGAVLTLDPSNGQTVSSQSLREGVSISPIAAGGRVVTLGGRGSLAAF